MFSPARTRTENTFLGGGAIPSPPPFKPGGGGAPLPPGVEAYGYELIIVMTTLSPLRSSRILQAASIDLA